MLNLALIRFYPQVLRMARVVSWGLSRKVCRASSLTRRRIVLKFGGKGLVLAYSETQRWKV